LRPSVARAPPRPLNGITLGESAMGLFSSVLHLRDVSRDRLLPALNDVLRDSGFARADAVPVPAGGPFQIRDHNDAVAVGPCYLVSPLSGRWITLIEAHFALCDAPQLAQLGTRLSEALSCHALALMVHDDDLFLYNLDHQGESLDGYNSCPQYFEQKRLPEADVEQQRHSPEPFEALVPTGRTLEELRALLGRGWWNAHDAGRLDKNGVPRGERDGFVFEGERMTAFGTLLQLHGGLGDYPYAAWGDGKGIDWPSFLAVRYRPA
jgi:hypothetical protein